MINRRFLNGQARNLPTILAFATLAFSIGLFFYTLLLLPAPSFFLLDQQYSSSGGQQLCHIPDLNPWDPSILSYVFQVPPLVCPPASDQIVIKQDPETSDLLLKSNTGNLTCRYRKVIRGQDDFSLVFGNDYFPITTFPFHDWPVDSEFLEVTCSDQKRHKVVYSDIFSHIHPVSPVRSGNKTTRPWSVLIVGIDSVSQLNFARSLPKSLTKLHEKGAIILKGYNKLGENTFPNLSPLLTGHRVELLPGEQLTGLPHVGSNGETFDDWPFIWHDYKRAGYATLYSEDMPRIGTFHWQKKGFKKQPTDHYGRTLFVAMDKLHPYDTVLNPILQMFESKDIHLTASPSLCYQGRKKHNLFWNYAVRQLVRAYKGSNQPPFFALTWLGEPSHDHVNLISICDQDLSELLDWLTQVIDDHTFVFVMSDHGARFDNIRNTLVGRIEDRMPFVSALLPAAFRAKYPQFVANFRSNVDRLTTPLDFYQTLKHILHISTSASLTNFPRLIPGKNPNQWSASLFSEVLPQTRSCWQANVPEHYCACYRETAVQEPNNNRNIQEAARFVIDRINSDLSTKYHPPEVNLTAGTHCAALQFDGIESASHVGATKSVLSDVQLSLVGGWLQPGRQIRGDSNEEGDYVIVTKAQPSGALFEAHVVKEKLERQWKIIGEIQRINAYGNTSWCISGSTAAKKFCHCLS